MTVTGWFSSIILIAVVFVLIVADLWREIQERLAARVYVRDEQRAATIAQHPILVKKVGAR
jgi:hypothetical protein